MMKRCHTIVVSHSVYTVNQGFILQEAADTPAVSRLTGS
jgi:hypothetical protein